MFCSTFHLAPLLQLLLTIILTSSPVPTFSKTVYYEFDVRFFPGSPNGVEKQILGVNGQFPGPTIYADKYDTLVVKVHNNIGTKENTSIHWHGLEHYQTLFNDGPEYVTQCPIVYGTSQTYRFILEQSGTYWWHSHHSWQYTAGYWGALVIRNTPEIYETFYDGEIIINLNDWYNYPVADIMDWYMSSASQGNPPVPDSILINGRGFYNCTVAQARGFKCDTAKQGSPIFPVQRGSTYRIRVINTAALITSTFSIDNHKLRVIEVDGVDTVMGPPVDVATLAPAQRYSFLVTMDGVGSEFWIRAKAINFPRLTPNFNQDPDSFDVNAKAVLQYYEPPFSILSTTAHVPHILESAVQGRPPTHSPLVPPVNEATRSYNMTRKEFELVEPVSVSRASKKSVRTPTTNPPPMPIALDERTCRPYNYWYDNGLPAPAFYTEQKVLNVGVAKMNDGTDRWSFNGIVYTMTKNGEPALYQVLRSKPVTKGFNPIYTVFGKDKVIQLVINNRSFGFHPFHLHGHTFWVIGSGAAGVGDFNPATDTAKLKLDGVRRDTLTVQPNSWVVARYYADNPGTWLFHCHINWHLHAGLGLVFVEGSTAIRNYVRLPQEWLDVCTRAGINVSGL